MEQENNNRKLFGFIIEMKEDSYMLPQKARILNNGVPIAFIIMQMRAFLHKAEKDYFDEFNTPESV